jgi:hypothetical protein
MKSCFEKTRQVTKDDLMRQEDGISANDSHIARSREEEAAKIVKVNTDALTR